MCSQALTGRDCVLMAHIEHSPRTASQLRLGLSAAALLATACIGVFAGTASATPASPAAPAAPAAHTASAEPGDTTTTTPLDNRVQGNSITRPNEGADPQSPADPGGWLQVSLFYLICGGIFLMVGLVWFSSRRARARQKAAGTDRLSVAKRSGKGLRAPSPLDTASKSTSEG